MLDIDRVVADCRAALAEQSSEAIRCGSAGLSGRRVANGSLATSVSCRVDGAMALSPLAD